MCINNLVNHLLIHWKFIMSTIKRYFKDPSMTHFRFSDDDVDYSSCPVGWFHPDYLDDPRYPLLETEHDVIKSWSDFAKNAFSPEFENSDLKCWEGHDEQFGMVMLNLAKMDRFGQDSGRYFDMEFDRYLERGDYLSIYVGPQDRSGYSYYRSWLGLIGHPDFQHAFSFEEDYFSWRNAIALRTSYLDVKSRLKDRV